MATRNPNCGCCNVTTIRFSVVSSDAATLTILGAVLSWDVGFTLEDVPGDLNTLAGISPPLGVVEICDPSGCYFDEPADQLFARQGWAKYMDSSTTDACRVGYPPYPPHWEVFALCCKQPQCPVA